MINELTFYFDYRRGLPVLCLLRTSRLGDFHLLLRRLLGYCNLLRLRHRSQSHFIRRRDRDGRLWQERLQHPSFRLVNYVLQFSRLGLILQIPRQIRRSHLRCHLVDVDPVNLYVAFFAESAQAA